MSKGSSYEREICKRLSLWWTDGKREDVFWRSAASGGRAKVRGRQGKQTHGQHGDICATDPIGQPLIDLFTIEIKRGYSKHTFYDLIDKPKNAALQQVEKWLLQTLESWKHSGSRTWMLIHKRDQREPMVMLDAVFCRWIKVDWKYQPCLYAEVCCADVQSLEVVVCPLSWLLKNRETMIRMAARQFAK
jgi:hypothetical protein